MLLTMWVHAGVDGTGFGGWGTAVSASINAKL
jgi:hypothetical protein